MHLLDQPFQRGYNNSNTTTYMCDRWSLATSCVKYVGNIALLVNAHHQQLTNRGSLTILFLCLRPQVHSGKCGLQRTGKSSDDPLHLTSFATCDSLRFQAEKIPNDHGKLGHLRMSICSTFSISAHQEHVIVQYFHLYLFFFPGDRDIQCVHVIAIDL